MKVNCPCRKLSRFCANFCRLSVFWWKVVAFFRSHVACTFYPLKGLNTLDYTPLRLVANLLSNCLCSHRVAVGLVRTKGSVYHCTRRTAMSVYAKRDSLEKTAKKSKCKRHCWEWNIKAFPAISLET